MMVRTRADAFLSTVEQVVGRHETTDLSTSNEIDPAEPNDGWQRLIEHPLIDWGSNPDQFDDEGVEPPTRETISRAIDLAQRFHQQGSPSPDSVYLDSDGGVVFDWREQDVTEVLHIWSDGTTEYQRFHGKQLVERSPL